MVPKGPWTWEPGARPSQGPPPQKVLNLCPHPKTHGLHGSAALGVKHCPLQGILELGSGSLGVTWSAL